MSRAHSLTLLAPLAGWSTPLAEAPDEVFATRMLGDGVAIDPTAGTLYAPCDGEVVVLPPSRHAVTLRSGACEILMHVGIDTVALGGEGFEAHTRQGATVRAGDALLTFDLDLIAQRARSALTPVIVTSGNGFRIVRRVLDREVAVGDFLLEVLIEAAAVPAGPAADAPAAVRRVRVGFEHGIHARPAALLAASLKALAADVRLAAHGREANARSTVALMALGVQRGDEVEIRATGPDATQAISTLSAALGAEADAPAATGPPAGVAHAAVAMAPALESQPGRLRGVTASAGIAVGKTLQLRRPEIDVREMGSGVTQENAALDRARLAVRARLERRAGQAAASVEEGAGAGAAGASAAREIAAAHLELLDDPELVALARTQIAAGKSAAFAWRAAVRESAAALAALTDPRLRERVDDLLDLESQVLLAVDGAAHAPPELPPEAIIIARELLPSQLAALEGARVGGICMAAGGPTSHAAILAAAMGIPALVALGPPVLAVRDGTDVVLDAGRGVLEIDPGAGRLAVVRAELDTRAAQRAALQAAAQRDCRTADGTRIEVLANIGSLAEARAAVRNGAEGCGLLRTEFLFLDRQVPPSAAEQTAEYQKIADVLAGRPLTIRTLDAGGDKPIPYLPLPPEENPALGLRGVRTSLAHPELLRTQLRAVLAVRPSGQCRLLLPMITDVAEIHAVRAVLEEVCRELGIREALSVGVMIETPASAVLADRLAAAADFLSIGTNDLTQYTLAMDRGHPQLAARLDALHPAVLRLIARTAEAARAHGRHAAVCGGLASEPLAAPLLIGLGVHELSAVPSVIPQLKARIASVSLGDCRALAQRALEQPGAAEVRALAADLSPAAAAVSA
jgi:phosphoenolpyruvate-protein phosphotransferase